MNETLRLLIENYCHLHDVKCKTLQNCYIPIQDFNKVYNFKDTAIFFYNFTATGIIQNISDLTKQLCKVKTYEQTVNYNEIVKINDSGIVQSVESDFVFMCDNYADIQLFSGANSMFSTLYNATLKYVALRQNI